MAVAMHPRTGVGLRTGDILVVLHDFNARTADELTLRKSERVELLEMDDGFGDGWYLGRHLSRGGTGLFPGVYTTKAPSTGRSTYTATNAKFTHQGTAPINHHQAVTLKNEASARLSSLEPQNQKDDSIGRAVSHSHSNSRDSTRTSVPPSYSSYAPAVQRSIGETLSAGERNGSNEDSPVMNETLSVIDEHITDLSTPRQSLAPPPATINEDSESEYSRDLDRQSYVAGPETDDEENEVLTEAKVRKWDHKKTSGYLRSIGVDPAHCDIFEEQEISGDVLLDMDQSFIHMKEYNFGVMGRRLKTWHKIREVQDEVKTGHKLGRQGTFSSNDRNSLADDASLSSSRLGSGSAMPRMSSMREQSSFNARHAQGSGSIHDDINATPAPLQPGMNRTSRGAATPPSPWRASMISDTVSRPSAALVRELTHSRRHSSIDMSKQSDPGYHSYSTNASPALHQKQDSMDRGWTMSGSMSSRGTPRLAQDNSKIAQDLATSPVDITPTDVDNDRGYFSGNEVENRKRLSLLRRRDPDAGTGHTRGTSNTAAAPQRHTRLSSFDSSKDNGPAGNSTAAKAYHSGGHKGRLRSASARSFAHRSLPGGATPPTVTNLEKEGMLSGRNSSGSTHGTFSSMQNRAKKFIGMRAASENLSQSDKTAVSRNDTSLDGSSKISPVASPTGSTTPSQASHSLEYDNPDSVRKVAEVGYAPLPRAVARARAKVKQDTSAYTRGLLKITPEEARKTCDYHGWMKKKSSSLMTTWKPRLFILRGRRLSYYYSEEDTEERGIIDISGHKVLVANNDAMVTLHAQITGATSPATNPSSTEPSPRVSTGGHVSTIPFYYKKVQPKQDPVSSTETTPISAPTSPTSVTNPFYFKLVPPKSGFSRAVQFTKPAVHYFQVDSVTEGRKWMGELMKATIMHDWATLESTNKQKTISLAKAQARGERPKALIGDESDKDTPEGSIKVEDEKNDTSGLNIQGLDYQPPEESTPVTEEHKDSKTDSGVGQATDIVAKHSEQPKEMEEKEETPGAKGATEIVKET